MNGNFIIVWVLRVKGGEWLEVLDIKFQIQWEEDSGEALAIG